MQRLNDKDISLFDAIYNNLCTNGFSLEKEYFEYSMKEGGYVILLDAYDEIRREKRSLVNRSIRELSNKYPDNNYFISSRPSEEIIGWNDFSEMTSLTLTKEQALGWFESQVLFGFEIINKYENVGINKKRKLASIIDEL